MACLPLTGALVLLVATSLDATEIATGFLLGPRYDQRAFYIRSGAGEGWQKTYSGPEYRRQAQGKLMNLRIGQALFEDEASESLDYYKRHGVLMVNISLQEGNPDALANAFHPDGSLKPECMARLEKLLRAADQRGMVVGLGCLDFAQDETFETPDAIRSALRNVTDWLIEKKFRNVILDIANEWDGHGWDFDTYVPQHLMQLMEDVRDRFQKRHTDYALPVGSSSDGRMNYPDSLSKAVDLVLLHANSCPADCKARRVNELKDAPGPILMTADNNGVDASPESLARELASCNVMFEKAAGWGFVPSLPFRSLPEEPAEFHGSMPPAERKMAYFHAVLDHIAKLTLARSPHAKPK
jgi:hypothetical protein